MNLYVGAARWVGDARGGLFWRSTNAPGWHEADLPQPVQVHAVTVHPVDRDTVWAATDRGLYRSTDSARSWHCVVAPADVEFWSIYSHPGDGRVLLAGTSPAGVLRSEDGGAHWHPARLQFSERVRMAFACRVMRFAADPDAPSRLYAAVEVGGALRSDDYGLTWVDCAEDLVRLAQDHPALRSRIQSDSDTEGMLDAHALCMTPAAPGRVMLAARMGLFDSVDGGANWRDMTIGRFSPLTYARDIRVSPHDPRVLYACLSPASRSTAGTLYRSEDAGATWSRADRGIQARATMMAVAVEPGNADRLHCIARTGQVFSSADGGSTWSEDALPDGVNDIYALACG